MASAVPAGHLRRHEEVVDEPGQAVRAVGDDLQGGRALVGRHPVTAGGQEVRVPLDRRDGRAQLVGDRGDEVVLHPFHTALAGLVMHRQDAHPTGVSEFVEAAASRTRTVEMVTSSSSPSARASRARTGAGVPSERFSGCCEALISVWTI